MATLTLGTNAATSLTALLFKPGANSMAAADVATINNLIRGDNAVQPYVKGAWNTSGLLHLPRGRGIIQMKPGDYIAVDDKGWPIVVSDYSIANSTWTHS